MSAANRSRTELSPSHSCQSFSSSRAVPDAFPRNRNSRTPPLPNCIFGSGVYESATCSMTPSARSMCQRYPVVGFSGSRRTISSPSRASIDFAWSARVKVIVAMAWLTSYLRDAHSERASRHGKRKPAVRFAWLVLVSRLLPYFLGLVAPEGAGGSPSSSGDSGVGGPVSAVAPSSSGDSGVGAPTPSSAPRGCGVGAAAIAVA
jgi:hypothetical protein